MKLKFPNGDTETISDVNLQKLITKYIGGEIIDEKGIVDEKGIIPAIPTSVLAKIVDDFTGGGIYCGFEPDSEDEDFFESFIKERIPK